jgi:hypothetical protein
MPGSVPVEEIQLLCYSSEYNHGTFYNAEILFCHTPLDQLSDIYDDNYGGNSPVQVFYEPVMTLSWTYNQWHGFSLDAPFPYNGVDNLLIEFRWQGDDGGDVYVKGWYPPGGNRVLDGFSLSNPTGNLRTYMNTMRIYYGQAVEEGTSFRIPGEFHPHSSPEPFRDIVEIRYELSVPGDVTLGVFDASGRRVEILVDEFQSAGTHRVLWRPGDLAPGVYFYRLEAKGLRATHRSVRVR